MGVTLALRFSLPLPLLPLSWTKNPKKHTTQQATWPSLAALWHSGKRIFALKEPENWQMRLICSKKQSINMSWGMGSAVDFPVSAGYLFQDTCRYSNPMTLKSWIQDGIECACGLCTCSCAQTALCLDSVLRPQIPSNADRKPTVGWIWWCRTHWNGGLRRRRDLYLSYSLNDTV